MRFRSPLCAGIRDEQARFPHLRLSSGVTAEEQVNTPLGRLRAYLDTSNAESSFGSLWTAALEKDPDGTRALLDELVGKLPQKGETSIAATTVAAARAAIAEYPGVSDIDRAHAYLSDKQPGFTKRTWHEQCFLADRFVATGKASY